MKDIGQGPHLPQALLTLGQAFRKNVVADGSEAILCLAEMLEIDRDRKEILGRNVMELSRDPASLFVLESHDSGREFFAVPARRAFCP